MKFINISVCLKYLIFYMKGVKTDWSQPFLLNFRCWNNYDSVSQFSVFAQFPLGEVGAEPGSWIMIVPVILAEGTKLSAGMVKWVHQSLDPFIELKIPQCWTCRDVVLPWTPGNVAPCIVTVLWEFLF